MSYDHVEVVLAVANLLCVLLRTLLAINIWKIAVEAIGRRERPEYLRRAKNSISGVASTPTTHDLHEDRTTLTC